MFNTDYKPPWNVKLFGPIAETKGQRERREEEEYAAKVKLSYSAPASDALLLNGKLIVSESIRRQGDAVAVRVVPVAGTTDLKSQFQSSAASKWSTSEWKLRSGKRAFLNPFVIQRSASDKIVGVQYIAGRWRHNRELIQHWRWLLEHPRQISLIIKRSRAMDQKLQDSALFI